MANGIIELSDKYPIVPAGDDVRLTITKIEAKPKADPKVIECTFKDDNGIPLNNRYDLSVDGGKYAFSILARAILGSGINELSASKDLPKFVGKTIITEVVHNESKGNTYANLGKLKGLADDVEDAEDDDEL